MIKNLVSIIIPNYNYANYLPECIESVIKQTYKNWELIIVDDNSKDNSRQIVESYIKKYPQYTIRLFHNTKGPSGTPTPVNIGIKNMKGEYFAWLSSDDYFHPEKLEKQVRFMKAHPGTGMVYSRFYLINEKGKKICDDKFCMPSSRKEVFLHLLQGNFINGNTVLIRKTVLDKTGLLRERHPDFPDLWRASEYELWLKIALHSCITPMNERLHFARFHDVNSPYNISGLGDRLNSVYHQLISEQFDGLKIKKYLSLKEKDFIMMEALFRAQLEIDGFFPEILKRHEFLKKNNMTLENKILNKMKDISYSNSLIAIANFYIYVKKHKESDKLIRKALQLNSESLNFKSRYFLASYAKQNGDFKKAEKLFSLVMKKDPLQESQYHSGALFHLGDIKLQQGSREAASKYFTLCLEVCPGHKKARELLSKLQ